MDTSKRNIISYNYHVKFTTINSCNRNIVVVLKENKWKQYLCGYIAYKLTNDMVHTYI